MANILICDDDVDIVSALKIYLSNEDYKIYTAFTGKQALDCVLEHDIDLVLMDVMMPEMDGIEATAKLREEYNIPVILLTAKSESSDKVLGLDSGADDYLPKPFGMLELFSRIRAVLRRSQQALPPREYRAGALLVRPAQRETLVGGEKIALTPKEFEILCLLLSHPGLVLSRGQIQDQVWGMEYLGETRTVDVHIRSLRQKLGSCGELIETVRGVGYRLATPR